MSYRRLFFLRKLVRFIGAGLVFLLPGEVLNNLIINLGVSGLGGFLIATVIYVLLLVIAFLLCHFTYFRFDKARSVVFYYLIFGGLGLFVEWNILDHASNNLFSQLAMFTYWGSIFLVPYMLVIAEDVSKKTKKYLWIYICLAPIVYILTPFLYYSIIPLVATNPLSSGEYFSLAAIKSIYIFSWTLLVLYLFYVPFLKNIFKNKHGKTC